MKIGLDAVLRLISVYSAQTRPVKKCLTWLELAEVLQWCVEAQREGFRRTNLWESFASTALTGIWFT